MWEVIAGSRSRRRSRYDGEVSRVLALFVLGACSYEPPGASATEDAASDGRSDGPANSDQHLAITEICVEGGAEFIEIHNPTTTTVNLSTYYLTDVNEYWKRPGLPNQDISVLNSDFLVKFPEGTSISAGGVIVVASEGAVFELAFGTAPTFTIGVSPSGTAMTEIVQPDQPALASKLTDDGELLVLFEWDGVSDRVRDVDIVVHGIPMAESNELDDKEAMDGPDAGSESTPYATDALTIRMTASGPNDDQFSYKRIALEAPHETTSGGNGITGHDETSENLQLTWDTASMPRTPGVFSLP